MYFGLCGPLDLRFWKESTQSIRMPDAADWTYGEESCGWIISSLHGTKLVIHILVIRVSENQSKDQPSERHA